MESILNYLFISLPEFYIVYLYGVIIFGYRFSDVKNKILGMAIIGAFISDLMWSLNYSTDLRSIITIVITVVLFKIFISNIWIALAMTLSAFGSLIISEGIMVSIIIQFINYDSIINNLEIKLLVTILYLFPLIIGIWFIHRKKWSILKWFGKKQQDKKIAFNWLSIIFLVVLQLLVIIYLSYSIYMVTYTSPNKLLLNIYGLPIFSIGLILINILLIMSVIILKNRYTDIEITRTESNYNEHLENLLEKLKMERHDFINEIQTIYGFTQAKMYDNLEDYMSEIIEHTRNVNRIIKIKNIPVTALLHTKIEQIESKGVSFKIIVDSNDTFSSIKGYDLVKIISNILDNAFRAVTEESIENPYVELYWGKQNSTAIIRISNNGPQIDKKVIEKLYKKGYTTKKSKENSGYGLAIVKSIVNKYKGIIEVESTEKLTSFIIKLPL